MSMFDHPEYEWRETFFLFHRPDKRPMAADVKQSLMVANPGFEICELHGNDEGELASMTVIATETYSAIDLSYAESDDLGEQIAELKQELTPIDDDERKKMNRISGSDMRLDLLHFERMIPGSEDGDDTGGFFDPGALILIINTIAKMSEGVGVDPVSATIM